MPIYRLSEALAFPPCHYAEPDGLLAVGGDLSPERLLLAYRMGIFPWYSSNTPILWWSPDPRLVLFPGEIHVSKSLRRVLKKQHYRVTFDRSFRSVMERCGSVKRRDGEGTWIVPEMLEAYCRLHELGFAHSVECWEGDTLAGGLYGVSLGRIFFGESMFALKPDASKVAFAHLVDRLRGHGCVLIDCQVTTEHLKRFGAREIPRDLFLMFLDRALKAPTERGSWNEG
ncbi:MAG: leucyl/phenylalanyl-tRNA--protein transferase [Syntrophobacteraceae bacterium]